MTVEIEHIDEHILLINYKGLIKPAEMLSAYTSVRDYSQTHDLHYVLLYAVESMYYEHELFMPEFLDLKHEVVTQETFRATIVIAIFNQSLRHALTQLFERWDMGHKLFFVKDRDTAFDLIESWED